MLTERLKLLELLEYELKPINLDVLTAAELYKILHYKRCVATGTVTEEQEQEIAAIAAAGKTRKERPV